MARRGDERMPVQDDRSTTGSAAAPRPVSGSYRIGDAERQQAIDVLRAHTGAGRLTLDEFSDLAGEVYAAQTYAELEEVGRRLPPGLVPDAATIATPAPGIAPGSPATASGARVSDGAPAPDRSKRQRFIGIMSGSSARGRWRPAARIRAFALWGSVNLDFREADLAGPVVVKACALMGSVCITVAEGARVEMDGFVLMGGSSNRTRAAAEPDLDVPVIRVRASGLWGGVSARSRKSRAQKIAAAEAAGIDPEVAASTIDLRVPGLLELPAKVLDDVAAAIPDLLAGPGRARGAGVSRHRGHHHAHRWPGPGTGPWDVPGAPEPPRAPRPPGPPTPPWARRRSNGSAPPDDAAPAEVASDGAAAAAPSGTLTMMVTDIVGSTGLAERLGDRRWTTVLSRHNELIRAVVAEHDGTEVKAQGDGFLVVFTSARRAILAAIEVQRAVTRCDEYPDAPLTLRVGLHTGEIVDLDGDVLGQNVIVAVRIAGSADPGEIVVSGLTRDLTASGGDLTFGPAAEVGLKGLSQPWRVHRVSWAPATS